MLTPCSRNSASRVACWLCALLTTNPQGGQARKSVQQAMTVQCSRYSTDEFLTVLRAQPCVSVVKEWRWPLQAHSRDAFDADVLAAAGAPLDVGPTAAHLVHAGVAEHPPALLGDRLQRSDHGHVEADESGGCHLAQAALLVSQHAARQR